jgi:mono/diheme cytochrome c family protein
MKHKLIRLLKDSLRPVLCQGTTSVVPLRPLFLPCRADFSPRGALGIGFFSSLELIALCTFTLLAAGCSHKSKQPEALKAVATGAALVESSGGKQIGYIGMPLDQPVVVQVNDASGSAVTGAAVYFSGPTGVAFAPASALTDSSGQVTATVSLGQQSGRYKLTASTRDASGKNIELKVDEIALGYQQTVGAQLNAQYCVRCHDPESTAARVSNMDNLAVKPHPFTEGDTLNKMTDADLVAIISHGGAALNKSPLMPPWGYTLSKSDIAALISYIRAVSDPPYEAGGLVYAQK